MININEVLFYVPKMTGQILNIEATPGHNESCGTPASAKHLVRVNWPMRGEENVAKTSIEWPLFLDLGSFLLWNHAQKLTHLRGEAPFFWVYLNLNLDHVKKNADHARLINSSCRFFSWKLRWLSKCCSNFLLENSVQNVDLTPIFIVGFRIYNRNLFEKYDLRSTVLWVASN